jgi:hypothetical protein
MKKVLVFFLVFVSLMLTKPFLERGLGVYFQWKAKRNLNMALSFRSIFINGTNIELKKLTFNKKDVEGFVDSAEVSFDMNFSKLEFFPKLTLKSPKIYIKNPLEIPSQEAADTMPVSITDGKVFVGEIKSPLLFSYEAEKKAFKGFVEDGALDARIDDERVVLSFDGIDFEKLLPFIKFFSFLPDDFHVEGKADGSIVFPLLSEKIYCDLHVADLNMRKEDFCFGSKELSLKLRGPFSKEKTVLENISQINTFISLSDGKVFSQKNPWQIHSLNGFFFLDSFEKFQSEFSAVAEHEDLSIPLLLEGKKNTCKLEFLKTRFLESGKGLFIFEDSSCMLELQNMTSEKKRILDLFVSPFFPKAAFDFHKGTIDTKVAFKFTNSELEEINLYHFLGKDLLLEKDKTKLQLDSFSANGIYLAAQALPLEGSVLLENGNGKIGDIKIDPLSINLSIKEKIFLPSSIVCHVNGVKTEINLEGKFPFFKSNISLDGNIASLFTIDGKYDAKTLINIAKREEGVFYRGHIESTKDRLDIFAKTKEFPCNKNEFLEALQFFECDCEHFDLKSLNTAFQDNEFSGIVTGKIGFEEKLFQIELDCDQARIQTTDFSLAFDEKVKMQKGIFDPSTFAFSFQVPFTNALFTLDDPSLSFIDVSGELIYEQDLFTFNLEKAKGEGFSLQGKAFYDPRGKIDLDLKNITGKVKSGQALLQKLDIIENVIEDIEGDLFAKNLVYSHAKKHPFFFSIDGSFSKVKGRVTDQISYEDLEGQFIFDTNSDTLLFSGAEAAVNIEGEEQLFLFVDYFTKNKSDYSFDFLFDQSFLEVARLKGEGIGTSFAFDSSSHYYGSPLENFSLAFCHEGLESLHLRLKQKFMKKNTKLLQNIFGLRSIVPLDGKMDIHFNFSKDKGQLSIKGSDLTVFEKPFKDLSLILEKNSDTWKLTQGKLDEMQFTVLFKDHSLEVAGQYLDQYFVSMHSKIESIDKWDIESFSIRGQKSHLSMKGNLFFDLIKDHPFSIDGDFSFINKGRFKEYTFINKEPLNLKFSLKDQLQIGGVDLFLFSKQGSEPACFKSKILKLDLQNEKIHSEKSYLSIPSEFHFGKKLFNKDLGQIDANLDIALEKNNIELVVHNGFFQQDNLEKNQFKELKVKMEKSSLSLDGEYLFDRSSIPFSANVSLAPSLKGDLTLFTPRKKVKDPLCIYWHYDDEFILDHLSGSFSGIDAEFCFQDKGKLVGKAHVDFSKLTPYMKPRLKEFIVDSLEMKEGYSIKGTFTYDPKDISSNSFSGYMTGKDFSFFGYELQTLFSELNFSDKGLFIDSLKMSDEGGMLFIDKLYFENIKDKTFLNIPKISFKDVRPSLLKEVGKMQKQEDLDPLIIKTVTIDNIYGDLEDESTITGKGTLDFINSFNRGKKNLFDLPSEVIGKIFGLDLELLIPVCGTLDFEIKDQKCLFTHLKDTYSENKRSQFFLFDKMTPYMDFHSNLHLFIEMKQFVLFKFTEQMIISLSGSIYDPKINLENKQQFDDKHP